MEETEIREIADRYIRGIDKFPRMFAGCASRLERYENGIIYLRIENTERAWPSNYDLAIQKAHNWVRGNVELKDAKGFVVTMFKTTFTGFAVPGVDIFANPDLIKQLVQLVKSSRNEKKELITIYSGMFAVGDVTP